MSDLNQAISCLSITERESTRERVSRQRLMEVTGGSRGCMFEEAFGS